MSILPSNAISAAVTPIQRQSNDALRARQVQSAKAIHHNEDVDELDDTGVDSIRDDQQNHGNQQETGEQTESEAEDKVEIVNLDAPSTQPPLAAPKPPQPELPRLDISA